MSKEAGIPVIIFVSAWASLAFEVTLTRIFSITLSYHFAFMIVSIAMLGYAASGTALSLYPGLRDMPRIELYALLQGCAIPLGYLVANRIPFDPALLPWERGQLLYVAAYYLSLALPFFFSGLVIATALGARSTQSGLLYGADLTGAGAGSLCILAILTTVPPARTVFLLAAAVLVITSFIGGGRIRTISLLLLLPILAIFIFPPRFAEIRIAPSKELPTALRYPGARQLGSYDSPFARIDTFTSPAARFAPGLSLRYMEPLPEQIGLAVDGGDTTAVTAAGDKEHAAFLEQLPSALPYVIGRHDRVLVIDPRGGLQLLVARQFGAGRITGVESTEEFVRVIRNQFGPFSGHIYDDITGRGLGRSWLRNKEETYDIIDVSLLGTTPVGTAGIGEEYRYTLEAFREYLAHLDKGGILSVNLYLVPPPRLELRLLATLVAALKEIGIDEPRRHLVAVRSWGTLCLAVKREPFSADELLQTRQFARERWFDTVWYPGMQPGEETSFIRTRGTDYRALFAALLDPAGRERFLEAYPFDIRPVRDDRPFFHYFLRTERLGDIYRLSGKKWQFFLEEGYLLPAILVQVALLGLVLVLLPVTVRRWRKGGDDTSRRREPARRGGGLGLLPYFALLGIGFMFVEIVLIQQFILPLEHPSHAVAAVLASLLVGSGTGSLLSNRYIFLRGRWLPLIIALLVVGYGVLLPAASGAFTTVPLQARFVLSCILLAPLAIPMGIPFPVGLEILGRADCSLIPWAWAINGCMSVIAPVLAVMLAMAAGFTAVLCVGAFAYLLAAANLALFGNR